MDLSRAEGQIFIATLLATALWGMHCMQTLIYFMTYQSDKRYFHILVAALLVLDTVHEIFCLRSVWYIFIPMFGGLPSSELTILPPEIFYQVIVTGVVVVLSHFFFMWRIWRFNKNWIFLVIIIPPTVGQLAISVFYATRGIGKTRDFLSSPFTRRLAICIDLTESSVDIFIAVTMSVILWKSRTGIRRTDKMVLRLIQLSISNGACIAAFGILGFVALLGWPNIFFACLGQIPACTIYCNVVLANLNSRKYIAGTDAMYDGFAGGVITGISFTTPLSAPVPLSINGTDDARENDLNLTRRFQKSATTGNVDYSRN